jgi:membrane associated rhomboid family serine protease
MIIPVGHEQRSVRNVPWITVTIFGICLAAFLLTLGPDRRANRESIELFAEIGEIYLVQPSLEIDPEIEDMLLDGLGVDENQREVFKQTLSEQSMASGRSDRSDSQARLDQLVRRFWDVYRGSPLYRFGVVPAHMSLVSLVTHQFLHGGWGHLFGNLLFLYLAAPYIEDRWGMPLFGAFYLISGVVAALFWAFRYPELNAPLVGASGAIAGVMGAFLICFGTSKIKFFYWFGIIWGTFDAPAWLMLPLWLAIEVVSGRTMDVLAQGEGGGCVAHWAHVWGFIFGMAAAAVIGYFGIDRKLASAATLEAREDHDAGHVDRAYEVYREGRTDEAVEKLRSALQKDDADVDAALALWNICRKEGRVAEATPVMLGVVQQAARTGDDDGLVSHWEVMLDAAPTLETEAVTALRIAETLVRAGRGHTLLETFERVRISDADQTPPRVLARLAALAAEYDASTAPKLLDAALASDELPRDLRTELEAMAERSIRREEPPVEQEPTTGLVELRPADRLRVVEAVPRSLDETSLVIELGDGQRRLAMSSVRAVAVGAVAQAEQRPFLIIDLLLDPPWESGGDLRVVRLRSTGFDPTGLVGGDNAMAAFHMVVRRILGSSKATPLPDELTVQAPSSRTYTSIDSYQQEVLGVMG